MYLTMTSVLLYVQAGGMMVRWRLLLPVSLLLLAGTRGQDFYNSDYADYYHPGEGNSTAALLYPDYAAPDGTLVDTQPPAGGADPVLLPDQTPIEPANPVLPPAFLPAANAFDNASPTPTDLDERPDTSSVGGEPAQPRTISDFVQPGLDSLTEQNLAEYDQLAEDIDVGQEAVAAGDLPSEYPPVRSAVGVVATAAPSLDDLPVIPPASAATEETAVVRAGDLCLVERDQSNIGKSGSTLSGHMAIRFKIYYTFKLTTNNEAH